MAKSRLFDISSNEYLSIDAVVKSDSYPYTLAAWAKTTNTANNQSVLWVGDKDTTAVYNILYLGGAETGDPVTAISRNTAGGLLFTTATYPTGEWCHVCAVFASTSDCRVYLNGGSRFQDTSNDNESTAYDRTAIGMARDSSPSHAFSGRIAFPAIWDIALSDEEVAALAGGLYPTEVQGASLRAYWLFDDNDNDAIGDLDLTPYSDAAGPAFDADIPELHEASSGTIIPVLMSYYRRLRS